MTLRCPAPSSFHTSPWRPAFQGNATEDPVFQTMLSGQERLRRECAFQAPSPTLNVSSPATAQYRIVALPGGLRPSNADKQSQTPGYKARRGKEREEPEAAHLPESLRNSLSNMRFLVVAALLAFTAGASALPTTLHVHVPLPTPEAWCNGAPCYPYRAAAER
ncbi:hypothetical protein CALCODRAFT_553563 [Calocera cornea HHB12733]|uniref:Uncharacterized protein n=1 Tax=Calocera cornea HHB12733 TaxID=1353952 RepID=A0A165IJF7_9BASI|nr:hypothetical protein CALCODRAFT_553563 [Calocera cornea HHB12733]